MKARQVAAGVLLAMGMASIGHAGGERQDAVLDVLAAGEQARLAGDHAALLAAAQELRALGARPMRGDVDIAAGWTGEAQAGGATLPPGAGYRGAALGPAYKRAVLGPGERYSLAMLFLGGQPARIAVTAIGQGGALSIRVRDGSGGRLCDKVLERPRAECAWTPDFTGRFDTVVENRGADRVTFFLIVR